MTVPSPSALPAETAAPSDRLSGHMGTWKLVLSVLAFSSPLVTAAGYLSLTILVAGETAPAAFLLTTIALLIFSVGYMAMTRRMPRTGAFYAYIAASLGKRLGLGSAFLAGLSYTIIGIGVYLFAGMTLIDLVQRLGGPELPWWIGGFATLAVVGLLGFFNIDVSARVLMWVMVVEVVLVLIFDIAVAAQGGAEGISVAPFDVAVFATSNPLIGILFGILVFIGFEATAIYRDEVKDPDRTVPRATYISVLFIGLLYTVSVWMLVSAFGSNALTVATESTGTMFNMAAEQFVGKWFADTIGILVITAILASTLSIHNAATRYVFTIGVDGGLPRALGAVHPRFKSPSRASVTVSIIGVITVLAFALLGSDPGVAYAQLAGLGSTGIIFLMALVSVAVVVWFLVKDRKSPENIWKSLIAPVIAAVVLIAVVVYALANFEFVVGGGPGENLVLLLALGGVFVAGIVIASVIKVRRPADYDRIGGSDRSVEKTMH